MYLSSVCMHSRRIFCFAAYESTPCIAASRMMPCPSFHWMCHYFVHFQSYHRYQTTMLNLDKNRLQLLNLFCLKLPEVAVCIGCNYGQFFRRNPVNDSSSGDRAECRIISRTNVYQPRRVLELVHFN